MFRIQDTKNLQKLMSKAMGCKNKSTKTDLGWLVEWPNGVSYIEKWFQADGVWVADMTNLVIPGLEAHDFVTEEDLVKHVALKYEGAQKTTSTDDPEAINPQVYGNLACAVVILPYLDKFVPPEDIPLNLTSCRLILTREISRRIEVDEEYYVVLSRINDVSKLEVLRKFVKKSELIEALSASEKFKTAVDFMTKYNLW
jgi:hypothetical protein